MHNNFDNTYLELLLAQWRNGFGHDQIILVYLCLLRWYVLMNQSNTPYVFLFAYHECKCIFLMLIYALRKYTEHITKHNNNIAEQTERLYWKWFRLRPQINKPRVIFKMIRFNFPWVFCFVIMEINIYKNLPGL